MKKIFSIVKKVIEFLLVIIVILFVLAVCLQRFSNNQLSILDYRIFTVITGSMEPKYNVGDVLISKKIDPEDIKVGDDLSYLGKSGTFNGKVVTHRVIKIDKDVDGNLVFHTKGLANIIEDPVIYADQIYGRVVYEAKILSFVYKCVSTPTGMFVFVIIPLLYVVGSEMIHFMLDKEDKRRNKLKKNNEEATGKEEVKKSVKTKKE